MRRNARPQPTGAYGRLTGPDSLRITWSATGGFVVVHLPEARASMNSWLNTNVPLPLIPVYLPVP